MDVAKRYYVGLDASERSERDDAARAASRFILDNEPMIRRFGLDSIVLQSDVAGVPGDVRDIVLVTSSGAEIGISAKVRNTAIRNSRLSPKIDFAQRWLQSTCSEDYASDTAEVWSYLEPLEARRVRWSGLGNKQEAVYLPLQRAFIREIRRQFQQCAAAKAKNLMRYMLGMHDYYKVYKHNATLSIESFNMDSTLSWGRSSPCQLVW